MIHARLIDNKANNVAAMAAIEATCVLSSSAPLSERSSKVTAVGFSVGRPDGTMVDGTMVGAIVGPDDGDLDGEPVGSAVGLLEVGAAVGLLEVGAAVGHSVPLALALPSSSRP